MSAKYRPHILFRVFTVVTVVLLVGLGIRPGEVQAAGTAVFVAHPTTPSFGAGNTSSVNLGDLDGDGDLDAVVANDSNQPETVWLNNGSGSFSAHPTTPSFGAGTSRSVTLGDLDGDGDLDAVVANTSNQAETVWLNNGSGAFSAHPTAPSFGAGDSEDVLLGDLDGDGDLDAVVANTSNQAQTVWLNNGSGTFTPHPTTPSFGAGNSRSAALGDLDGDGDLDAVVANTSNQAETVWLNNGSGAFSAHPTAPSIGTGDSISVKLGDLEGDGDLDAVVANTSNQAETVWLNNGSGAFSAHPTAPSFGAGDSEDVSLGDLDTDGDLDAVVGNYAGGAETVWLNNGSGAFSAHPTAPSFGAGDSTSVVLGDLNADGNLDTIVGNYTGQAETVWLNRSANIAVTPTSGLTTTEAGGTATFTVVLTDQPTADVTIDLTSSNTSEGTVAPASLTFTAANWNTPQTVTVTGVDDALDDGNITYTIVTSVPTTTDPAFAMVNPADVSISNSDDDYRIYLPLISR